MKGYESNFITGSEWEWEPDENGGESEEEDKKALYKQRWKKLLFQTENVTISPIQKRVSARSSNLYIR